MQILNRQFEILIVEAAEEVHILNVDKGNATLVINISDYKEKIHDILNLSTHRKLSLNPSPCVLHIINELIHLPSIPEDTKPNPTGEKFDTINLPATSKQLYLNR